MPPFVLWPAVTIFFGVSFYEFYNRTAAKYRDDNTKEDNL